MTTFVISKNGVKLTPTTNPKKVRKLLKSGRATIFCYDPFTIQLQYETTNYTQPIEFKEDAGYQYIGISIASEKHEYVSEERILLKDEVEHHNDCRKLRRTRRNRKRYRAKRFDNRKASKPKGWQAPSIANKKDQHVKLFEKYNRVCPITSVVIEVGQFDTQVLQAIEKGEPIPQGLDYQHGPMYGQDTLREAVFFRDNHTCICCGKSAIKDNAILCLHHLGFWKGDRTNRMSNLATVCTKCHTPKNHKPNGKLYGLGPSTKSFKGAAFMNAVRYQLYEDFKGLRSNVNITYGSITKRERLNRNISKSHANDAYCMGKFHPVHRCKTSTYQKRRRNNRVLEKFYDAKYIDIRDGSKKAGKDLGCERTNRREPRNSPKNLRIYHGEKVSKGYRSIRRQRYQIQPGTIFTYNGQKYCSKGVHNKGTRVITDDGKSIAIAKVIVQKQPNGWIKIK